MIRKSVREQPRQGKKKHPTGHGTQQQPEPAGYNKASKLAKTPAGKQATLQARETNTLAQVTLAQVHHTHIDT